MQKVTFLKSTEFVPTQEFILVKPQEEPKEQITETGIILTGSTANKSILNVPTYGTVIDCGPDVEQIQKGDNVFWPQTDGLEFEFKDGEFKLIRQKSVIGIHKKE